jgi:hypothetical protein
VTLPVPILGQQQHLASPQVPELSRMGDASALSEAGFQEEVCTSTVRRAFDKAVSDGRSGNKAWLEVLMWEVNLHQECFRFHRGEGPSETIC